MTPPPSPQEQRQTMKAATTDARQAEGATGLERLAGKYLTFHLGEGEYGIPVRKVREIIKLAPITEVPHVAPWMKGVINLRGKVIPIVDLRRRFELSEISYNERTCIVVLETAVRGTLVLIGVIVDSVSDVLSVSADQIELAPLMGAGRRSPFVEALAKVRGAVKILLNLDGVCGVDEETTAMAPPVA